MRKQFGTLIISIFFLCGLLPVSAQGANFAGTWNLRMTPTKDTCNLGLAGKPLNLNGIVIKQNGSRATLKLQGISFAAIVSGNTIKGSGSVSKSGVKISGTIKATLVSKKRMSVPSTKINITGKGVSCYVLLKGTGTKV
ncbi:MAG: hypothetical protein GYA55_13555 [SAR324 cluster bacterium]|uniref:Polymer-forming cytoskeletal protein n=1 Tax=SAR324 cluster bacterium TaxID=2024889 RepID=A0A7X9IMM1_9DELT|nr:hypothetical protein [SAR324 cluster bacterium]